MFDWLRREIDHTTFRASSGLRHLAGIEMAAVAQTPRSMVWSRDKVALYRYKSPNTIEPGRPPILLVMSLVTRPTVFDLLPNASLAGRLLADGHDVFLLDWGIPDAVEAENTLETYCDEYLPLAMGAVLDTAEASELVLLGYCLGAVLGLLTIAGHSDLPVRAMLAMATPVDFAELGPMAEYVRNPRLNLNSMFDETGNVPADVIRDGFRWQEPTGGLTTYLNLWNSLSDRDALAAHQALVGWSSEHIPFPGAAFRQIVELFVRRNTLALGKVPLGDRIVDLGAITLPMLVVTGERDHLVPARASAPLPGLLHHARLEELHFPAGHAGLFVGRRVQREFMPALADWLTAAVMG